MSYIFDLIFNSCTKWARRRPWDIQIWVPGRPIIRQSRPGDVQNEVKVGP